MSLFPFHYAKQILLKIIQMWRQFSGAMEQMPTWRGVVRRVFLTICQSYGCDISAIYLLYLLSWAAQRYQCAVLPMINGKCWLELGRGAAVRCGLELSTNLRKVSQCPEKAPANKERCEIGTLVCKVYNQWGVPLTKIIKASCWLWSLWTSVSFPCLLTMIERPFSKVS